MQNLNKKLINIVSTFFVFLLIILFLFISSTTNMLFNYSLTLILKLIFLIIFIILSIYLLYQEYLYEDKLNSISDCSFKKSSSKFSRVFVNLTCIVIPSLFAYRHFYRDEMIMRRVNKELENTKQQISELKAENNELRTSKSEILQNLNKTQAIVKDIELSTKAKNELQTREAEINSINNKALQGQNLSTDEQNKVAQEQFVKAQIQNYDNQINSDINKIEELRKLIEDSKKNSVFISEFDYQKFLDNLSKEELLAFSGLLLNSLVLSYSISIILVLYGNYLITRFDLENRYPKLAKFIKIRRQIQNYYIKICFCWIFIGILPQIFIYSFILSSRIFEFLGL